MHNVYDLRKAVVNKLYSMTVVTGLSRITKTVFKTSPLSLDFEMRDLLMSTLYIRAGLIVTDTLVRQGTLLNDILK